MIINLLPICYHPDHQPFSGSQAANCQTVDSEKPASKLIRAVLRVSEIDPQTWEAYSIHRCHCKSKGKGKDEMDDELDSGKTLDQLGIKEGDSIFFRKREDRVDEMEEDQNEVFLPLSKKRKERDDFEVTSQSSLLPPTPKSNLENLEPCAAATAKIISKLLGGEAWKTEPIGSLGLIQTRGLQSLRALQRAIKMSLQIPQISDSEAGCFNSDLNLALIRAYHQRISSLSLKSGKSDPFNLGISDYEQANELLKGKIRGNGSWERGSLSHLNESAFSKPISRFPLSDSGLSGLPLKTARVICVLWNNDKWINQTILPGVAPISLRKSSQGILLRQIAQLTRVKPSESTPDGLPPLVLKALRDSIKMNEKAFNSNTGGAQGGWSQKRCIPDTLALLKKRVATTNSNPSSLHGQSSGASGSRGTGKRSVRPRLDGGK